MNVQQRRAVVNGLFALVTPPTAEQALPHSHARHRVGSAGGLPSDSIQQGEPQRISKEITLERETGPQLLEDEKGKRGRAAQAEGTGEEAGFSGLQALRGAGQSGAQTSEVMSLPRRVLLWGTRRLM